MGRERGFERVDTRRGRGEGGEPQSRPPISSIHVLEGPSTELKLVAQLDELSN